MSDAHEAPARVGLCLACRHMQRVTSSRDALFYLCRLSTTDPRYPRYPVLPVTKCEGFAPVEPPPRSADPN